jgi:mannose-6-phosphate isomerase-like protein (cupin superfamily)
LISSAASGGAYTAIELSARPGWARPAYVHHQVDQRFYVAKGEFEGELDDQPQPVRLRHGSLLYVPPSDHPGAVQS